MALALAALSSPASAVDYIWQGGSGLWTDSAKWTLLGVPGANDTATIGSAGAASVVLDGTLSVGQLTLNSSGWLGGTGTLNAGSLTFNGGTLSSGTLSTGGTLNVQGTATLNGSASQSLINSYTLNLNGDSTWTAGNGRISVESGYNNSGVVYPSAVLRIASGATFSDLGAASSTGYKTLGGGAGNVVNDGTYTRTGLGTTWVRGLNNTGTVNVNAGTLAFETGNWFNYSSGQVNVARGAELLLAATTFTAGTVNNAGKITVIGNDSFVQSAASISGNWQVDNGRLFVYGTQRIGALTLNGGSLAGTGTVTADQLTFNGGTLSSGTLSTGGTLNVQGTATLNGSASQSLINSYTLNLNGDSTWTAGNGRISVESGYNNSGVVYPSAVLRIASGATFSDLGAASSTGYKTLGGGSVVNEGLLTRTGLGATEVKGLVNQGTLSVSGGALGVDDRFGNTGTVSVDSSAVLYALNSTLRNAGLISGNGTVKTYSASYALTNSGTLAPGSAAVPIGTLTIDGDLSNTDTAIFSVDLGAAGTADRLVITADVLWNGTLSVNATPGLALHVGDSFVVATFDQRLTNSVFDTVSWHGAPGVQLAVEYNAHDVTLRVTSVVPEPATHALWLLGLAGLGVWRSRRNSALT